MGGTPQYVLGFTVSQIPLQVVIKSNYVKLSFVCLSSILNNFVKFVPYLLQLISPIVSVIHFNLDKGFLYQQMY